MFLSFFNMLKNFRYFNFQGLILTWVHRSYATSPISDPFKRLVIPVVKYTDLDSPSHLAALVKAEKSKSGIYAIVNNENGKVYIGSSHSIGERISRHFGGAPKLTIQHSISKYGPGAFSVYILEYVVYSVRSDLYSREQYYITLLSPLYNIRTTLDQSDAPLNPISTSRSLDIYLDGSLFYRTPTIASACRLLGVSHLTIKAYLASGKLLAGYLIKEADPSISFVNPIFSESHLESIQSTVAKNMRSLDTINRGKVVYLFNSTGDLIQSFPAMTSLASHLNVSRDDIKNALNYGTFIKGTSFIVNSSPIFPGVKTPVQAIPCVICKLDGTFIKEVPSIKASANFIGVAEGTVRDRLNTGLHIIKKYLVYTKVIYSNQNKKLNFN